MQVEHESSRFEWLYDSRMGVGYFRRKCDGARTYLETGTDCQDTRRALHRAKQKCESPRRAARHPGAPSFADMLDILATAYEFHPEESDMGIEIDARTLATLERAALEAAEHRDGGPDKLDAETEAEYRRAAETARRLINGHKAREEESNNA